MSYCATTRTATHAPTCFREVQECGQIEHVHDERCFTSSGRQKCPHKTHTHGAGCIYKAGPLCGGT